MTRTGRGKECCFIFRVEKVVQIEKVAQIKKVVQIKNIVQVKKVAHLGTEKEY
jgi:hypothetical protein